MQIIQRRNLTARSYCEVIANAIAERVVNCYDALFHEFEARMVGAKTWQSARSRPSTRVYRLCSWMSSAGQSSGGPEWRLSGCSARVPKGNFRSSSDIDLAIEGQSRSFADFLAIKAQLEDLSSPRTVDLLLLHQIDNPALMAHIRRVGVPFYFRKAGGRDESRPFARAHGARSGLRSDRAVVVGAEPSRRCE